MVSTPLASVTSTSFSSTPGNSAVKSIASLLSAMSILGASMSEPNPASGERREKSSNVFWTSRNSEPNGSSSRPKSDGKYDLAMVTSFDLRPTLETEAIRVLDDHHPDARRAAEQIVRESGGSDVRNMLMLVDCGHLEGCTCNPLKRSWAWLFLRARFPSKSIVSL